MSVLAAEWIKLRSVRATFLLAAATVATTAGIGLLGIGGLLPTWLEVLPQPWDPTALSLKGILVGQLLIAVLGASAITSEYASGSLATTLTLVPRRSVLLASKAGAVVVVALATSVVSVVLSFVAGQAVIAAAGLPAASLTAPDVVRALACAVAYLTLLALGGLACGVLTRSSAGALGVIVAVALLAPALLPAVPGIADAAVFWPTTAGQASYVVASGGGLPPLAGIGVLALCTLYATIASHLVLRLRDV